MTKKLNKINNLYLLNYIKMASIDSNIYTIHNAYEYLRSTRIKKIPNSITYEQWCTQLRESNGKIYVKNLPDGSKQYLVRYEKEINILSIPVLDDENKHSIAYFKGLGNKIPYKDYDTFNSKCSEYGVAICFSKRGYDISYNYETDDELDETDFSINDSHFCVTVPPIS